MEKSERVLSCEAYWLHFERYATGGASDPQLALLARAGGRRGLPANEARTHGNCNKGSYSQACL